MPHCSLYIFCLFEMMMMMVVMIMIMMAVVMMMMMMRPGCAPRPLPWSQSSVLELFQPAGVAA